MSETEQLLNRLEELQGLPGVGNDDVSRLLVRCHAATVRNGRVPALAGLKDFLDM